MSIDALEDFLGPQDALRRQTLLEGARKGDAQAIEQLWAQYRCRLIPVATQVTEAVTEKTRKRPWIAGKWRGFKAKA